MSVAQPALVEVRWNGAGPAAPAEERLAAALEQFGSRALQRLRRPLEVSVLLCDGAAIRGLNRRYRGLDAPTDVLSFGQLEGAAVPAAGNAVEGSATACAVGGSAAPDSAVTGAARGSAAACNATAGVAGGNALPGSAPAPLAGDVVIAVDVAARQAAARGEAPERELRRLLLHGILHLLGMDHADPPAEDEPMLSLQERMLAELQAQGQVPAPAPRVRQPSPVKGGMRWGS